MMFLRTLVLLFMVALLPTQAAAVSGTFKRCISQAASKILNADSAENFYQLAKPIVQEHVLGSRSFGRNWKIDTPERKKAKMVRHYLTELYRLGIDRSRDVSGVKKAITVVGVDGTQTVRFSYDSDSRKETAHIIKLRVKAGSREEEVAILAMVENNQCRFGDIGPYVNGSIRWWSKDITSP